MSFVFVASLCFYWLYTTDPTEYTSPAQYKRQQTPYVLFLSFSDLNVHTTVSDLMDFKLYKFAQRQLSFSRRSGEQAGSPGLSNTWLF